MILYSDGIFSAMFISTLMHVCLQFHFQNKFVRRRLVPCSEVLVWETLVLCSNENCCEFFVDSQDCCGEGLGSLLRHN